MESISTTARQQLTTTTVGMASTLLTSNLSTVLTQPERRQGGTTLPYDMTFNEESVVAIVSYCIMFVISATSNLAVLAALCSSDGERQSSGRRGGGGAGAGVGAAGGRGEVVGGVQRRKRVQRRGFSLLIMHLCVADLVVTFVFIPLEVGWHATVAWTAGDTACRALMFARAFGFYLSSFVLVAIAIDRYFCLDPLHGSQSDTRIYVMLTAAWAASFIASFPQVVVFHVESHPQFVWFTQCVTFNSFPSAAHENVYNVFNFLLVYFMPLLVILVTYSLILARVGSTFWRITRQTSRPRE